MRQTGRSVTPNFRMPSDKSAYGTQAWREDTEVQQWYHGVQQRRKEKDPIRKALSRASKVRVHFARHPGLC